MKSGFVKLVFVFFMMITVMIGIASADFTNGLVGQWDVDTKSGQTIINSLEGMPNITFGNSTNLEATGKIGFGIEGDGTGGFDYYGKADNFIYSNMILSHEPTSYNYGFGAGTDENVSGIMTAQSFKLSSTSSVSRVFLKLNKINSPTNYISVRIETDNGGTPSGTLANDDNSQSEYFHAYFFGDDNWAELSFKDDFQLTADTTYWLVFSSNGEDTDIYTQVAYEETGTYEDGFLAYSMDGTWDNNTYAGSDLLFRISDREAVFNEGMINFWFNATSLGGEQVFFISQPHDDAIDAVSGNLRFVCDNSVIISYPITTNYSNGEWNMITILWNNTEPTTKMYINNLLVAEASSNCYFDWEGFEIGSYWGNYNPNGIMDEITLYNNITDYTGTIDALWNEGQGARPITPECLDDDDCGFCEYCNSSNLCEIQYHTDLKNDCNSCGWCVDDGGAWCEPQSFGSDIKNACSEYGVCETPPFVYYYYPGYCGGMADDVCYYDLEGTAVSDGNICINLTHYDVNPTSDANCGTWSDCIIYEASADEYYVGYKDDTSGDCSATDWQSTGTTWNTSSGFFINTTEAADVCIEEAQRGSLPTATVFDGSSTDFNNVFDLTSVEDMVLEDTSYGKISWNIPVNVSGADLDSYVYFADNLVGVDSSSLPNLNVSANISIYVSGLSNPVVFRDGVLCDGSICTGITYVDDKLNFSVTQFSNYTGNSTEVLFDGNIESGSYYLDQNYTINSTQTVESDVLIDCQGNTLDIILSGDILFATSGNATFDNCVFSGSVFSLIETSIVINDGVFKDLSCVGPCVRADSGGEVYLNNCSWINVDGENLVLLSEYGKVSINGGSFTDISLSGPVIYFNMGVGLDTSTMDVNGVEFNNVVSDDYLIYYAGPGEDLEQYSLTISGSTFKDSSKIAYCELAGLCLFSGNTVSGTDTLFNINGITNFTFKDNLIENATFAGDAAIATSSTIYWHNNTFNAVSLGADLLNARGGSNYIYVSDSVFSNMVVGYAYQTGYSLLQVDNSYDVSVTNTRFENIDGQVIHAYNLLGSLVIDGNTFLNTTSLNTNSDANHGYAPSYTIAFTNIPSGIQITNNNMTDFGMIFSNRGLPNYPSDYGCGGGQLTVANNYLKPTAVGLASRSMFYFQSSAIDSCPDSLFENNTMYIDEDLGAHRTQFIYGCIQRNNAFDYKYGWRYFWETLGNTQLNSYTIHLTGSTCTEYVLENNLRMGYTNPIINPRYLPVGYPGGAVNVLVRNNTFDYLGFIQIANQYQPVNAEIYDNYMAANNVSDVYSGAIRATVYSNDFNISVHDNIMENITTMLGVGGGCSIDAFPGTLSPTGIHNLLSYDNDLSCDHRQLTLRNSSLTGLNINLFNAYNNTIDVPLMKIITHSTQPTYVDYPIAMGPYMALEEWQKIPIHIMNCSPGACAAYNMLVDGQGAALDYIKIDVSNPVNLTGFVFNSRPDIVSFDYSRYYGNIMNYTSESFGGVGDNLTSPVIYYLNVTSNITGNLYDYTPYVVEQRIPNESNFDDPDWADGQNVIDGNESTYATCDNEENNVAYGYMNYTVIGDPIGVKIKMIDNGPELHESLIISPGFYPGLFENDVLVLRTYMQCTAQRTYVHYCRNQSNCESWWTQAVSDTTSSYELYEVSVEFIYVNSTNASVVIQANLTNGNVTKQGYCGNETSCQSPASFGFSMGVEDPFGYWSSELSVSDLFASKSLSEPDVLWLINPCESFDGTPSGNVSLGGSQCDLSGDQVITEDFNLDCGGGQINMSSGEFTVLSGEVNIDNCLFIDIYGRMFNLSGGNTHFNNNTFEDVDWSAIDNSGTYGLIEVRGAYAGVNGNTFNNIVLSGLSGNEQALVMADQNGGARKRVDFINNIVSEISGNILLLEDSSNVKIDSNNITNAYYNDKNYSYAIAIYDGGSYTITNNRFVNMSSIKIGGDVLGNIAITDNIFQRLQVDEPNPMPIIDSVSKGNYDISNNLIYYNSVTGGLGGIYGGCKITYNNATSYDGSLPSDLAITVYTSQDACKFSKIGGNVGFTGIYVYSGDVV